MADTTTTPGGVPVAADGTPPGSLLDGTPGQVQWGYLLMGAGSSLGWRDLQGWRSMPAVDLSDAPRPVAHGDIAGAVYAQGNAVTFTALLTGTPADKAAAVKALEDATAPDGVERALVVDDGGGPELRWGRVIAREIPQDGGYRIGPVQISLQWRCADPRRYGLVLQQRVAQVPRASGGLVYPLAYPLEYGTQDTTSYLVGNNGNTPTPVVLEFRGPLDHPTLTVDGWRMAFDLALVDSDVLTVDTFTGTVLLNGGADRLYTLTDDSTPVEACMLPPGSNAAVLSALSGDGDVILTWRDARL